jgi:hypothetical protein
MSVAGRIGRLVAVQKRVHEEISLAPKFSPAPPNAIEYPSKRLAMAFDADVLARGKQTRLVIAKTQLKSVRKAMAGSYRHLMGQIGSQQI